MTLEMFILPVLLEMYLFVCGEGGCVLNAYIGEARDLHQCFLVIFHLISFKD